VYPISAKVGDGLEKFKENFLLFVEKIAKTMDPTDTVKK
jgi:hypothetical protein